jgi:capsular polysaccharide export protein
MIDRKTVHFDPEVPSELEVLLATHPLDDTALLNRARGLIARMQEAHLTKYCAIDADIAAPPAGYVLVIDQTYGDAAVKASGADHNRFLEMLLVTQEENPGARIVIKTHPATAKGLREGYFEGVEPSKTVSFIDTPISPWRLFEGAIGVYTVSSQMGFEAIFTGHKPRVFGQPFYAGWGLTVDEFPVQRRQRTLTRAQLFAASMLLYPKWYDAFEDRLATAEEAAEALIVQTRAWTEDHRGWVASGMRLWKRGPLQKIYGQHKRMIFRDDPAKARQADRPWMVWAGKAEVGHHDAVRVEDGFIRSRGLGAELVPPLSLVTDNIGIYYDPSRPSRLEKLIEMRGEMRLDQITRADALIQSLTSQGISKYNLGGAEVQLPKGERVLVVGQVEDDASIRLGAGEISTNGALLENARAAHPDAILIYKPHPDVTAGLRAGAFNAAELADLVLPNADISTLLSEVSELWTMTSLTGFEALLRGIHVVTTGAPFYAGWGLTQDLGDVPPRRRAEITLAGLVHATLIDYPRYFDPKTGLACPVEVAVKRLANGDVPHPNALNRLISKLLGVLASSAHLWR